jgi:hypothetical protein
MLAWRGHLRFRVYNPGKIIKYGILVRMVCKSDSGYIYKLMTYSAAEMTLQNTVLELLSSYLGQGYKVYIDNYYNSVVVAKLLHERKNVTLWNDQTK